MSNLKKIKFIIFTVIFFSSIFEYVQYEDNLQLLYFSYLLIFFIIVFISFSAVVLLGFE